MSFSRVEYPTARKVQACVDCGRRIDPGERYVRATWADGDDLGTATVCQHCHVVALALGSRDEWFSEANTWGGLAEAMPFADCALDDLDAVALLRLEVGFRRAWRRCDGGLMPVPSLDRGQRIAFVEGGGTVWWWLPSLGGFEAVGRDGACVGTFDFLGEAEHAAGPWGRVQAAR